MGLATIGFGQGVAVTPIQLITAVSSLGNNGKTDETETCERTQGFRAGKPSRNFQYGNSASGSIRRKQPSEICDIMEYVVEEGGGGNSQGRRLQRSDAKTGTADKVNYVGHRLQYG